MVTVMIEVSDYSLNQIQKYLSPKNMGQKISHCTDPEK